MTIEPSFPLATPTGRCPYSAICTWKYLTEGDPGPSPCDAVSIGLLAHRLSALHAELAASRSIEHASRVIRKALAAVDELGQEVASHVA